MDRAEEERIQTEIRAAGNLPVHVAVIMDGNGRWASRRGMQRISGHRAAIEAVRETVRAAGEVGVRHLTLFAFSSENWNRPKHEVSALMRLLRDTLRDEKLDLMRNNVQLMAMGRLADLPGFVVDELDRTIERLQSNTGLILNLALSYGGRAELVDACRRLLKEAETGERNAADLDEAKFARYLYTPDLPDPDLLIRTSGEFRISNFLLWQLAYTEIHITPVLWPDFRAEHLYRAIQDYQARERRFGLVGSPKS